MRVTVTVTLNGTNVNPYNKLWGLKQNPFPQIGDEKEAVTR